MNSLEKNIYNNYLQQYERIEKFDSKNLGQIKYKLDKEIKSTYLPSFKEYMPKDKNVQILDLGSGFGRFAYFCDLLGYKKYTGIDLSGGIGICTKLFPDYKFIKDDFNNYLTASEEEFDVIFISHVLEHLKKDAMPDFLEKIRSKLKDNGIAIITVPNAAAYFGASGGRYIDFTHEIAFTPESLEEILIAKSFKLIQSSNIKINVPLHKKFMHKIVKSLFELLIKILGYKIENIYTPAFFTVVKK